MSIYKSWIAFAQPSGYSKSFNCNATAPAFSSPNSKPSFPFLSEYLTHLPQFNSFATCAASSRAGKSFAAQVVIAACVISSVIPQSDLGIGILQALPSPVDIALYFINIIFAGFIICSPNQKTDYSDALLPFL
jgi:hypothetical protein